MTASQLVRLLLRRWFLVLPLVLLGGIGAAMATEYLEPEYSASASVLVLPPLLEPGEGEPSGNANPYAAGANASGFSTVGARVLAQAMVQAGRADPGLQRQEVSFALAEEGPFVFIAASATSLDLAERRLALAAEELQVAAVDLQIQAGADVGRLYQTQLIAGDVRFAAASTTRLVAAGVVVSLLLASVLVVLVEAVPRPRAGRRRPARPRTSSAASIGNEG